MTLTRLPPIRQLTADSAGVGFYLCQSKEVRTGRNGDFLSVTLLDSTGRVGARIFDDVNRLRGEFEEGDFVKVEARADLYRGQLQLIIKKVRRVNVDQDRLAGFREEDCIPSAPRPIDEMWAELQERLASVRNAHLQQLLARIVSCHEKGLRTWPAAQVIHHAYRGGYLEHVLKIAETSRYLADVYGADPDLVLTGAILHDIGKLQELSYDGTTTYSRDGRLLGHIALGVILVREVAMSIPNFPPELLTQVEHLVLSHHGSRELGSPVEPMTAEAFILSMADDLDAKIYQVKAAIAEDANEGEFTAYQQRFGRVLWKGTK